MIIENIELDINLNTNSVKEYTDELLLNKFIAYAIGNELGPMIRNSHIPKDKVFKTKEELLKSL
jgi:hypothetical protein